MRLDLDQPHAFFHRPLYTGPRLLLALLVVPLVLSFTQPLWRISMRAPQYPAGLFMDIYAHKVQGGNDGQHLLEINILNHYIGMRKLDAAAFADTGWIPFALGALALGALAVALTGRTRALLALLGLTGAVSAVAFGRFLYMLYTFGHHLNPEAPMHVKPFMPAVIGGKQIANFTTYSLPQVGSALLGVFVLGLLVTLALQLRAVRARSLFA